MAYNKSFLDVEYTLIIILLSNVKPNVLDISYDVIGETLNLQIVLLHNTALDKPMQNDLVRELPNYLINFNYIFTSKAAYNLSKGKWRPSTYNWLPNVILSKSQA
jgi:hypothetical protein